MTTPQDKHQFLDVEGQKLNVGCGRDVRPAQRGWVNVDGFVDAPGVVKHDVLAFPWPFPSDQFALVYCSHVLEHIPPTVVERDGVKRDVMFLVFEEIHRVLRPGGLLVVRVPWGYSEAGLSHVQHYRQWRPEWAHYFDPDHEESHYSKARFRLDAWKRTRGTTSLRAKYVLRFGRKQPLPLTQHLVDRAPFLKVFLEKPSELELRMRKV